MNVYVVFGPDGDVDTVFFNRQAAQDHATLTDGFYDTFIAGRSNLYSDAELAEFREDLAFIQRDRDLQRDAVVEVRPDVNVIQPLTEDEMRQIIEELVPNTP